MSDSVLKSPVLLSRDHHRELFDCGVPALNEFLKKYALQNQKKDAARTYVAVRDNRVAGYYTLAYGSIAPSEAANKLASGLGRYPIPVMLLARLADDVTERGRGLGADLLRDALLRTIQAAEIAGLRALIVHAKDDAARAFYEKFGFEPSPSNLYHLFLPVSEIRKTIGREEL